jgi:agmatine deiminase
MPAEWFPHHRTLLAWPSATSLFPSQVSPARSEVAAIASAISRFEPVTIYSNLKSTPSIPLLLTQNKNVKIVEMELENLWIRDTGPVFVTSTEGEENGKGKGEKGVYKGVDFGFNYWGAKFELGPDIGLASRILKQAGFPLIQAGLCAEGGALEVDGQGTLLATESSLINPNRNPGLNKTQIEEKLKSALGLEKVTWFKGVRDEDATDCHIDALARFVEPGTVLLSLPHGSRSEVWWEVYEDAREVLEKQTDARGRKFKVVELMEPQLEVVDGGTDEGGVFSYVNYYLVNGGVIAPSFGDQEADEKCKEVLGKLFPGKEVLQVRIDMLPRTGGGIHCATQQVPQTL